MLRIGPKTENGRCDLVRGARGRRWPARTPFARAWAVALVLVGGIVADQAGSQWVQSAEAQTRASISVGAVTNAEAASRTRLPIQIGPPDAIPKNSFVRIRGLPPAVALSEGHSIAPGSWAVPLAALPSLTIILPVGQQGPSEVAISLVSIEGTVLAEAKTTLVVAVAGFPRARMRRPPAPRACRCPGSPRSSASARSRLHAKGLEQLERGNVYAARKFFELAGEIGLAQSAVAAAGTYDPDELAKLRVLGLQPDVEAARKWYERARELGAVEAAERLRRLGSR